MLIFKDKLNRYRWLGISASNHLDRDQEYIAAKALIADVERTNQDGKYGPLRWWHEGNPDPNNADAPWGAGVDLASTDFAAIHQEGEHVFLIESGLFYNPRVGAHFAKAADQYALSVGFFSKGVNTERAHEWMYRLERSIAPKSAVSNRLTWFNVKDNTNMDDKKRQELLKVLEGDADLLKTVEAKAAETAQKAQALQLGTKTTQTSYEQFAKLVDAGIDPKVAFKAISENVPEVPQSTEIHETTQNTTEADKTPENGAQQATGQSADVASIAGEVKGLLDSYFSDFKQQLANVQAVAQKASAEVTALKASVAQDQPGTNRASENQAAQAIAAALKTQGVQPEGEQAPLNQLESQFQRFMFGGQLGQSEQPSK